MNFALSDDQLAMRDSLRRYLVDEPTPSWRGLCELGLMAALMTEEQGGIGGKGRDIALVFEELGRACVTSPALQCFMSLGCKTGMEQDIILGTVVIAPALYEESSRYGLANPQTSAVWLNGTEPVSVVITGRKIVVPDEGPADYLIVSTKSQQSPTLFLVPARSSGINKQRYGSIDGQGFSNFEFAGVEVGTDNMLECSVHALVIRGLLAIGAEALGLMDAVRDMTVEYLKQRRQFGKQLSDFQVLQHRLADMAMAIEQVRSSVINAAEAFDQHDGREYVEFHALKHQVGEVGRLVAEEAIQLHGAIGMTQDYSLGKYAKRLIMLDHLLGDSDWHLTQFGDLTQRRAAHE